MIHLFHSNEMKFNFLKKLVGCLCFDFDPERDCKLFADKFEMDQKFQNGVHVILIIILIIILIR